MRWCRRSRALFACNCLIIAQALHRAGETWSALRLPFSAHFVVYVWTIVSINVRGGKPFGIGPLKARAKASLAPTNYGYPYFFLPPTLPALPALRRTASPA